MEKANDPKEGIIKKIYSYIAGEHSKTMYISSGEEQIISFPWLLAVLFLIVFDVPSWTIGALLICLVVFDLDLNVKGEGVAQTLIAEVVDAEDYSRAKRKNSSAVIKTDSDGYSEITIQ